MNPTHDSSTSPSLYQGTPQTISISDRTYNPHSGRGRRRTNNEAPSKRSGQMREAQRVHRERKRNYLLDLEAKATELETAKLRVAELEALLESKDLSSRIKKLEKQVGDLKMEVEFWKLKAEVSDANVTSIPPVQFPTMTFNPLDFLIMSTPSIDSLPDSMSLDSTAFAQTITSAEQALGPINVEPARLAFKALPSLNNYHGLVDTLIDTAIALSRATVANHVKLLYFKAARTVDQVMDACTVLDRAKSAEIVADGMGSNARHFQYVATIWASLLKERTPSSPATQQQQMRQKDYGFTFLRAALLDIPSLSNAPEQIDEFFETF
ncbi:UNVERIFIED_CONTAM: hypothetical protein HDU68_003747, partial [Siphonaria sp. JEL0065]